MTSCRRLANDAGVPPTRTPLKMQQAVGSKQKSVRGAQKQEGNSQFIIHNCPLFPSPYTDQEHDPLPLNNSQLPSFPVSLHLKPAFPHLPPTTYHLVNNIFFAFSAGLFTSRGPISTLLDAFCCGFFNRSNMLGYHSSSLVSRTQRQEYGCHLRDRRLEWIPIPNHTSTKAGFRARHSGVRRWVASRRQHGPAFASAVRSRMPGKKRQT